MSKIYEALEQVGKDRQPPPDKMDACFIASPDIEEQMTALHCLLHSMIPKQGGRTIQFIGSAEGEGASTIAREFARTAADKIGNAVLLVDMDNHSPNQHDAFEITAEHDWMESIRNKTGIENATVRVGRSNLSIGMISRDGDLNPQILDTPDFKNLWNDLAGKFEFIVLDSPPVSSASDGVLLSPLVDGVILVVEAEKTRWPVVQISKEKIAAAGGNILGVVLNKRKYYIPESIYSRL